MSDTESTSFTYVRVPHDVTDSTSSSSHCDVTPFQPSYASSRSSNLSRGITNSSMMSSKLMSAKFNPSSSSLIIGTSLNSGNLNSSKNSGLLNSISGSWKKLSTSIGLRKPKSSASLVKSNASVSSLIESVNNIKLKGTLNKVSQNNNSNKILKSNDVIISGVKFDGSNTKDGKITPLPTFSVSKMKTNNIHFRVKSDYSRVSTSANRPSNSKLQSSFVQKSYKVKLDGKGRPVSGVSSKNNNKPIIPSSSGLVSKVSDSTEIVKSRSKLPSSSSKKLTKVKIDTFGNPTNKNVGKSEYAQLREQGSTKNKYFSNYHPNRSKNY